MVRQQAEMFKATPTGAFPGQVFFAPQAGQTGTSAAIILEWSDVFQLGCGNYQEHCVQRKSRLQLRAEAFNVLNNVNFFLPTGPSALNVGEDSNIFNVRSATFGQIPATNNYGPRIMQFAVRFEF